MGGMRVPPRARVARRGPAPPHAALPDGRPMTRLTARFARWLVLAGLALQALAGCADTATGSPALPTPSVAVERAGTIVLGEIDPKAPAKRIAQLQPLADYLAFQLRPHGIRHGRVVVAPDEGRAWKLGCSVAG